MNYYAYIFFILFAILGVFLYILINNKCLKDIQISPYNRNEFNFSIIRLITILFLFFFCMSLFSLLYVEYTKSFWYYFFISLCAAITGMELLFISSEKQGVFNLIKSYLLSVNIIFSNQIVFPNGIALPDFNLHFYKFIVPIVQTGYIPDPATFSGNYEYFPLHHIFSSISIIFINFDPKLTYLYLGGFLISSGVLFIYLIGKKIANYKFGLLSALLFTCLDY